MGERQRRLRQSASARLDCHRARCRDRFRLRDRIAWRGIGTPAPFDPPRRLVTFSRITTTMLVMIAALWLTTTIFIITFEEPTLRSKFGDDYAAYCRNVRRWIPRLRPFDNSQPAA
jgi:hypothetical protein